MIVFGVGKWNLSKNQMLSGCSQCQNPFYKCVPMFYSLHGKRGIIWKQCTHEGMNSVRGGGKKQCELGNRHSNCYSHGNDGLDVTTDKLQESSKQNIAHSSKLACIDFMYTKTCKSYFSSAAMPWDHLTFVSVLFQFEIDADMLL